MRLTPASIQTSDDWLALWLALSVTGGLVAGIAAALALDAWSGGLAVGLAVTGASAVPGVASRALALKAALFWNRLARAAGRRLTRPLLGLVYFLVIWPAGLPGDTLAREAGAAGARWVRRDRDDGEGPGFARWSASRGDPWALFLVPFLVLLRSFEARAEGPAPEGIYTLF